MRYPGDFAAAVMKSSEPKPEPAPAAQASVEQPRSLTRVSSREYNLRTAAPMQAPLIRSASLGSQFKPLVRIEFSRPQAFSANPASANTATMARGRTTIVNPHLGRTRPEERRVGQERVSPCTSRWSTEH